MKIEVSAPSNIALIKYMGKIDSNRNRPTNSSFSYTLDHLRTFVEITSTEKSQDEWAPLEREGFAPFEMSEKGKTRFLAHFQNLKNAWGLKGNFLIKSGNNFPSDCGLASSASSFAALTMGAGKLLEEQGKEPLGLFELADWARQGSGSSCRSFFGPWVLWNAETGVRPLEFPTMKLNHAVVIVESKKKMVSSSEAHRRVVTSPLFMQRPERAEERLAKLVQAFREDDWAVAADTCWSEFWDMHALFETSKPPFGYFETGTIEVLGELRKSYQEHGTGPLVTMDAGANVHLLYRDEHKAQMQPLLDKWIGKYGVFSNGVLR